MSQLCWSPAGKQLAQSHCSFSSPPPLLEKYPLKSMSCRELVLPLDYQDVGQGRWIAKIWPGGR